MDVKKTHKPIDMSKISLKLSNSNSEGPPTSTPTEVLVDQGHMARQKNRPLETSMFPDLPRTGVIPPTTIANTRYLLRHYRADARFNVIKKRTELSVPGTQGTSENADNVNMSRIVNLAAMNGMATGTIPEYVAVIADENAYNPAADWINSKPWDGVDRLTAFCNTVTIAEDYPLAFAHTLIRKWLLSAAAAVLTSRGFRARGVLTFQGNQGIGKTSWVRSLISDPILRDELIKTDHHMDGGDKDSKLGAIAHWIVEIGELDSSFKKDIARLKGFLTSDTDKVRRPYMRMESEYPRRTVFIATVNEPNFLIDATGNSRWWVIPVTDLDFKHTIDMQQLYAQLAVDLAAGAEWWLTPAEEQQLDYRNSRYRAVSVIRDKLLAYIDADHKDKPGLTAMTPTELLEEIEIKYPTNGQARECGSILRELLGPPKRVQGRDKWRVPIRCPHADPGFPNGQPDPYD